VACVLGTLEKANLTVISMLGDYAGAPYTNGSARFICIAAARWGRGIWRSSTPCRDRSHNRPDPRPHRRPDGHSQPGPRRLRDAAQGSPALRHRRCGLQRVRAGPAVPGHLRHVGRCGPSLLPSPRSASTRHPARGRRRDLEPVCHPQACPSVSAECRAGAAVSDLPRRSPAPRGPRSTPARTRRRDRPTTSRARRSAPGPAALRRPGSRRSS
jgi:hypothetical protein